MYFKRSSASFSHQRITFVLVRSDFWETYREKNPVRWPKLVATASPPGQILPDFSSRPQKRRPPVVPGVITLFIHRINHIWYSRPLVPRHMRDSSPLVPNLIEYWLTVLWSPCTAFTGPPWSSHWLLITITVSGSRLLFPFRLCKNS